MNNDRSGTAEADRLYREWMADNLALAAKRFGLALEGTPTFGWLDRSIAAPALEDTQQRWLRVVSEQPAWSHGDTWTGNRDANALMSLPKPQVLGVHE